MLRSQSDQTVFCVYLRIFGNPNVSQLKMHVNARCKSIQTHKLIRLKEPTILVVTQVGQLRRSVRAETVNI